MYQAETGLNQNMRRDFDPAVGRYVESDPIGLRGGLNTCAYVENYPIGLIDPSGLLACTYVIASHTLVCSNNAGQVLATPVASSGTGACQDNPGCTRTRDTGPLPTGTYAIKPPGYVTKHPTYLYLVPSPNNDMKDSAGRDRNGFFIHPWGISNGCVILHLPNVQMLGNWAQQDGGGSLKVWAEDF